VAAPPGQIGGHRVGGRPVAGHVQRIAELWSSRIHEAEAHLERAVDLVDRIGRPFVEISGLAHWGMAASFRSSALAAKYGRQAIELVRRHGWAGEPLVAIANPMLDGSLI
jgi:LuxR family maltose regulon positive regulatory protein